MDIYGIRLFDRMTKLFREVPSLTKGLSLPCWQWTGATNRGGYGYINVKQEDGSWRPRTAHRAAYQALIAPIPDGLELDHLCRVRSCCNPWHLEPVTKTINVRRGLAPKVVSGKWQKARTECPQGHPYDQVNTARRNGRRHCRACDRERARRNKQRARERSAQ